MIEDLIKKNRSYRRFHQEVAVDIKTLRELINLARLSASAANKQPLKYILSCDPKKNALIFPHLAWAAYLNDWPGPPEGEKPSAYIIILNDTQIAQMVNQPFWCDHGIVCQSILLGAVAKGLGGCIFGSIKREDLRTALNIPAKYEILLVIALGKPKETIVIESVGPDGNIKYWRDSKNVHHVPKRDLKDIILHAK